MKDRIKFNDAMLSAVMDGRKTQTRRPIDKETLRVFDIASEVGECFPLDCNPDEPFERYHLEFFPYGEINSIINIADKDGNIKGKIEITDVWVQQVQEISQDDAHAEGFELTGWIPTYGDPDSGGETFTPYDKFADAWIGIYGEDSWNNNEWVWVIEFKKVE
ncbi:ASCH domain-containing protein [Hafnia alvei]|uniref:ASCH domain-containing protein n=1 Tax=Proteus vulgaris TaxID=585 RepID=UPI00299EC1FF|nr:ASCH domain-containing protein [Proteus vulgaris]WOO51068.1 ASCH domain-containing protein [Hafnia alvei]WPF05540.1 ASCH domain-containing protein [Proteus vulgaris]